MSESQSDASRDVEAEARAVAGSARGDDAETESTADPRPDHTGPEPTSPSQDDEQPFDVDVIDQGPEDGSASDESGRTASRRGANGSRCRGEQQVRLCTRCGHLASFSLDVSRSTTIRIGCSDCGNVTEHRPIAGSRARENRPGASTGERESRYDFVDDGGNPGFDDPGCEAAAEAVERRVQELREQDGPVLESRTETAEESSPSAGGSTSRQRQQTLATAGGSEGDDE